MANNLEQRREALNKRYEQLKKRVEALSSAQKKQVEDKLPRQKIGKDWVNEKAYDKFEKHLKEVESLIVTQGGKDSNTKSGKGPTNQPKRSSEFARLEDRLVKLNQKFDAFADAEKRRVSDELRKTREHFDKEQRRKADLHPMKEALEQKVDQKDLADLSSKVEALGSKVQALENANSPQSSMPKWQKVGFGLLTLVVLVVSILFVIQYASENSFDAYEAMGVEVDKEGNLSLTSPTE